MLQSHARKPRSVLPRDDATLGVAVTPVRNAGRRDRGRRHRDVREQHDRSDLLRALDQARHACHLDQAPEIEHAALKRCDLLFLHSHDAAPQQLLTKGVVVPEVATDRGWKVASGLDFASLPTLPELIAHRAQGRAHDDQVTCFINNVGLGYQFAAAGSVVYRKAREGLGRELPTDWFTEDVHP